MAAPTPRLTFELMISGLGQINAAKDKQIADLAVIKHQSETKDKEIQKLKDELQRKDMLWSQALEEVDRHEKIATQATDDLESEKSSRRLLQQELKLSRGTLAQGTPATLRENLPGGTKPLPYVVALLHISPETCGIAQKYLDNANMGGKLAADLLEKLDSYCSSIGIDLTKARIQVRLYWDFNPNFGNSSLGDQFGMRYGVNIFGFFRSFNEAFPFVESTFLSVRAADITDGKICDNLKLHISNPLCAHVILGVCSNSKISNTLQPVAGFPSAGASSVIGRITLLDAGADVDAKTVAVPGPVKTLRLDNVLTWKTKPKPQPQPQPKTKSEGTSKRTFSNAFQPYVSDDVDGGQG